jgi:hypothetical protein
MRLIVLATRHQQRQQPHGRVCAYPGAEPDSMPHNAQVTSGFFPDSGIFPELITGRAWRSHY